MWRFWVRSVPPPTVWSTRVVVGERTVPPEPLTHPTPNPRPPKSMWDSRDTNGTPLWVDTPTWGVTPSTPTLTYTGISPYGICASMPPQGAHAWRPRSTFLCGFSSGKDRVGFVVDARRQDCSSSVKVHVMVARAASGSGSKIGSSLQHVVVAVRVCICSTAK